MELSHEYIAVLVRRSQAGDSDAYAELYSLTYSKVYTYCRCYLKDDYAAQDAVQDIYITALKNINKINDPTLFVAWLNQISFRTCFDISKKKHGDAGYIGSELMEEISDTSMSSDPEASTFSKDERERLNQAITTLPAKEQELINLRFYKDMKIDDIVSITGLSKSTVKRKLQSAIEELKKKMS